MKKRYEYKDIASNSSKFWEVNLKGKQVKITYGRIGIKNPATKEIKISYKTKDGKIKKKPFKSEEQAKAYVEEKIREKTNKGYIEK